MSMCRKLTTKVVATMVIGDIPTPNIAMAIICDDPAYTMRDIIIVLKSDIPLLYAIIPKIDPTGRYPNTTGDTNRMALVARISTFLSPNMFVVTPFSPFSQYRLQ